MSQSRLTASAIAIMVVLATSAISQVSAQEVKLETDLMATAADPLASGKAKFESRADRTRFSTQVEDVSINGMGTVTVQRPPAVGNVLTRMIDIFGGLGDLNLDSRDSQVPALQMGDVISVFNPDGTLILKGTLKPK